MRGQLCALARFVVVLCLSFPLWAEGLPIHAPRPITRPHQRSIHVDMSWKDFINFEVNRGPNAVNYLEEVLKVLDPAYIQKLEAYNSWKNTRLLMSSFEVRSQEVLRAIEVLLEKGVHLSLVMGSDFIEPMGMPTEEEWEAWGPRQRAYFVKAYDFDEDGEVSRSDLARINKERALAIHSWEQLKEFQERFPNQVELLTNPREVVPAREDFNYPRIHHMKLLSYQFRSGPRAEWQKPVYAWVTSSNFTETGLSRRVANMAAYMRGEPASYDPQSQGQIQFGASFKASDPKSADALQALISRLGLWMDAYRKGDSFDSVPPSDFQEPRVVFSDGSSLQAFFTEGVQLNGDETIDPIWIISKILFRKDIQLTTYYDAQFVFTHTNIARLLRTVLNYHKPERFGLMVDSSQAVEPWSAIPSMLFAPFRRASYGVYPGKAIESYEHLASELKWQDNVLVYRGGSAIRDLHNDKLHLKARYFEYIDALGVTHYVVAWGSANSSHNASKLSADVYYLFQSTDPEVGRQLRPFFEALKDDQRMQPYSQALLERYLFENFYESRELRSSSYIKRWESFLTRKSQRRSLQSLVNTLETVGASTRQGKFILDLLKWHLKYNADIANFDWEDFELILHLSQDDRKFSSDFLDEVIAQWTIQVRRGQSHRGARQSLHGILKALTAPLPSTEIENPLDPRQSAQASIYENCRDFLAIVKGAEDFKRQRYPIVESKSRRRARKAN